MKDLCFAFMIAVFAVVLLVITTTKNGEGVRGNLINIWCGTDIQCREEF